VHNITEVAHDVSPTVGALGEQRTQGHLALVTMNLQCDEGEEGMGRWKRVQGQDARWDRSSLFVCPGRWVNWASAGSRPVTGESGQACRNHPRTRRRSRFTASCPCEDAGMSGEGISVIRMGKQGGAGGMLVRRREPGRRKWRWEGWAGEVVQREEEKEGVWYRSDDSHRSQNKVTSRCEVVGTGHAEFGN